METEFFAESLSWDWLSFVKIDDIPFLSEILSLRSIDNNSLSFIILIILNIKSLGILSNVDEVRSIILEDLEPL